MITTISYRRSSISVRISDVLKKKAPFFVQKWWNKCVMHGEIWDGWDYDMFWFGHDNRLWKPLPLSFKDDMVVWI
jgi:hypothetical protein